MKIHQMSGEHSESAGLRARLRRGRTIGGTSHTNAAQGKTTSEVITVAQLPVITSEVGLISRLCSCVTSLRSRVPPKAALNPAPSWSFMSFMVNIRT